MEKDSRFRKGITLSVLLLALFLVFTVMVKTVDTAPVGFAGERIGFSAVNKAVHDMFPYDEGAYEFTKILGYVCLMVVAVNGLTAAFDFFRQKCRISMMDSRNIITCVYYVVVGIFYVLFEFVVINNRPIAAEASYPSSHTMLALCVLYSEFVLLGFRAEKFGFWASIMRIICLTAMISMVVFRALCGVHWITDICGGVLLSLSLMSFYGTCIRRFCR